MINHPALLIIVGIFLLQISTARATSSPSLSPSLSPSSLPSSSPSLAPTLSPSTCSPLLASVSPSSSPSYSSCNPTMAPTLTRAPTITQSPSQNPTNMPSKVPTVTFSPSSAPTLGPTQAPTETDSPTITRNPSVAPSSRPTLNPSVFISSSPTTSIPTQTPTTFSPSSPISQILTIKLRFSLVTFRSLSTREKNEFEDNIQLCISRSENVPLDAVDLQAVSSIADGGTRITTEILFFSLNSATFFMERVSNNSSAIFNTENLFRVADYGVPVVEDVCFCTMQSENKSSDSTSLVLLIIGVVDNQFFLRHVKILLRTTRGRRI